MVRGDSAGLPAAASSRSNGPGLKRLDRAQRCSECGAIKLQPGCCGGWACPLCAWASLTVRAVLHQKRHRQRLAQRRLYHRKPLGVGGDDELLHCLVRQLVGAEHLGGGWHAGQ